MSVEIKSLFENFLKQRTSYERTRVIGGLLSTIARKLPPEFYSSPSSYVEPLETLNTKPWKTQIFKSAAEAKKWVFEENDDFAWVGVDGSQLTTPGMVRQGLAVRIGICTYCLHGEGQNKRNYAKEWGITRPVTQMRAGFWEVNSERYIQEIEHARCIVSFILEGDFPCDNCLVCNGTCPNQMYQNDLSVLRDKDKILLMVDFPLEPSWLNQTTGEERRQILLDAHQRLLDLRSEIFLIGVTHASRAKDFVTSLIDQFDTALWQNVSKTQVQDLINTVENWVREHPKEAEAVAKEWAEMTGQELTPTPIGYLNAILESPQVRSFITDFEGLGSYFDSSGDRSPAFKCKRKDMERFELGFVTGYYITPWGGFRKMDDSTVMADDWIRVGFGIRPGLDIGNAEYLNELHRGVLSQVILGHGTPLVLSRAHLYASLAQRKMIELMIRALQATPTYKTLRKVKPI